MANLVEGGDTPLLPPKQLEALGYRIAAYPLTLLSAATRAMQRALDALGRGEPAADPLPFAELRAVVGFDSYDAERMRYAELETQALLGERRRYIDAVAMKHWDDYTKARDKMFDVTDSKEAPWYIIRSDDKRRARLN